MATALLPATPPASEERRHAQYGGDGAVSDEAGPEGESVPEPEVPYAILRIKRKRTEIPLDALLVDPPGKRQRRGKLESADAISRVFTFAETVDEFTLNSKQDACKLNERIVQRAARWRHDRTREGPQSMDERKDALAEAQKNVVRAARFQVVKSDEKTSTWDVLHMYDAVREDECDLSANEEEGIMCNFLPMVKEYLSLNEPGHPDTTAEKSEYVYDIYYQEPRPHACLGDSVAFRNVGSLAWFNPEDLEGNVVLDEDSDTMNSDDEDSNAEGYYMNDYPDEDSDFLSEDYGGIYYQEAPSSDSDSEIKS